MGRFISYIMCICNLLQKMSYRVSINHIFELYLYHSPSLKTHLSDTASLLHCVAFHDKFLTINQGISAH